MMNNKRLVNERSRDIGNFLVGRLLPFKEKRQVGPFTFIDHMGPVEISDGKYFDINQHPHIGLSTLTYLLDGEIEHRDSTGSVQVVRAGDVGFMTSGKGVTHTERTPQELRDGRPIKMHGYQIWVALPKDLEESEPKFQFIAKDQIPELDRDGFKIRVVAGKGFGVESPLQVHSPLFMVDIYSEQDRTLNIHEELQGEIAIVVVQGKVKDGDDLIDAGQMLISKTDSICTLDLQADTRLLLFGGTPFPEERFLLWNFVSSSKERLQQAKQDWADMKFPKVPGDETYIPFK
ncbi:pirin family protein [bacterium]|nr:pirin family protein [bacterium]